MESVGVRHQNLDQKVYAQLKSIILQKKIKPGAKIDQDRWATDLGISKTPLVFALKMLENEGLIKAVPRKGYYVRLFTKQEMIYLFELREVLEGLAARRAAIYGTDDQIQKIKNFFQEFDVSDESIDRKKYSAADRQFHNFLVEIGEKEFLPRILQTFNIITFSYLVNHPEGLVRPPKETLPEHKLIIEAIVNKDPIKAEELTRLHVQRTIKKLIANNDGKT
jgi:DNA-binding GntR family transcriptional regulator